jgi:hypothetical protein
MAAAACRLLALPCQPQTGQEGRKNKIDSILYKSFPDFKKNFREVF